MQEALTNVRKHSGARHVSVKFECEDRIVHMSVEDDGHGFDATRLSGEGSEHFGLQIMRERAAGVGGSLRIDSGPNVGTRVVLSVPLVSPKEKAA